ncbi:MAG TPA: hypothetical protein VGM05_26470 [Planctomycetaceae bacterium]|jgi:hypothetical protein
MTAPAASNLFEGLFPFHPREDHWPKENFLTESFAYLLRTDKAVLNCWLSRLLGRTVKTTTCEIDTRPSVHDVVTGTSFYPDLWLHGYISRHEPFDVLCEHKWESHCNPIQLARYSKEADSREPPARLVFVGATHKHKDDAAKYLPGGAGMCFLWEDVYEALDKLDHKSQILKEFLDFMKNHGLSRAKPLTIESMRGFLHGSELLEDLSHLANRLNDNFSWDIIPKRFHAERYIDDRFGRIGIRFETPDWRPALTIGFLFDGSNHRVQFLNPEKGIDLLLRIEAEPRNTKNIQPVLDVLASKRRMLLKTAASALLKGEPGNGNAYSVLIVRCCLGDLIERAKTANDQLAATQKMLNAWLKILFDDGKLESAFRKCKLDSA